MIRHSPAENYFKYLVAHPNCYDNKYIEELAAQLKLDYLGDWYIQWLRERVLPPKPFYPENEEHGASFRFMQREGLYRAFQPDKYYDEALRILAKPRWRELVEAMACAGAPNDIIAHAVRVRMRGSMHEESIRLYKHFFWNIDLLESMEMRALLELRNSGHLAKDDVSTQRQFLAIRSLRHTDPRSVASRLPSTPLAGILAQMEMGVMPRKIDLGEVVERTLEAAILRTHAAVLQGGPMGAQLSAGFSMTAEAMGRLRQLVVNPEDKLREDLRKIGVATTSNKVPTVAQLTGGNHTVNVMPEPVEVETTAEEVEDD